LKIHESEWEVWISMTPHFRFCKEGKRFEEMNEREAFDLIYFDAFAPRAQPELWERPLLSNMYSALRPGGVMVTYCAKGAVKRILKEIGFKIEALKGPPGKREMTWCIKPSLS
jgi:tRNA U34 5-methylaminomethyl-2-thiouridine-forming methyltransferase MnmC